MNRETLSEYLNRTFAGLDETGLPAGTRFSRGKVRDIIDLDGGMIICTSDRISAFDRILTTVPCKGEVLNLISLYWFEQTSDIIPNHIEKKISSRTVKVKKCSVLPVEIVVRAYLTGSAWRDYRENGIVSGISLDSGMRFNQRFPEPLVTPSTKAEQGTHDIPISSEEIVSRKIVDPDLWYEAEETALRLFRRGSELAASRGLILVDTKYEFGISGGRLVLVDEIHTPDSSRYWYADTYGQLFEAGEKQRKIDKEYLRQWLMEDRGFMGDGETPEIPDEIRLNVAERYIRAFETITGQPFSPEGSDPKAEGEAILRYIR